MHFRKTIAEMYEDKEKRILEKYKISKIDYAQGL